MKRGNTMIDKHMFEVLEIGDMILIENTDSNYQEYPTVWRKITAIDKDGITIAGGYAKYEQHEILDSKSKYEFQPKPGQPGIAKAHRFATDEAGGIKNEKG